MDGRSAGKRFARDFQSLREIFSFVEDFFVGDPLEPGDDHAIKLAVEELFTNMVKYNPGSSEGILLDLRRLDDRVEVSLTDFDTEPFDIRAASEVRTDRPIEERRPGGLGIHLIKKVIDRIEYEHAGRRGKTTFIKMLSQNHA